MSHLSESHRSLGVKKKKGLVKKMSLSVLILVVSELTLMYHSFYQMFHMSFKGFLADDLQYFMK